MRFKFPDSRRGSPDPLGTRAGAESGRELAVRGVSGTRRTVRAAGRGHASSGGFTPPRKGHVRGDPRAGRGLGVHPGCFCAQCWVQAAPWRGRGEGVPGRQGGSERRAWPPTLTRALLGRQQQQGRQARTPACILRAAPPASCAPALPLWPTRDWEVSARRPHCELRCTGKPTETTFFRFLSGFFPG